MLLGLDLRIGRWGPAYELGAKDPVAAYTGKVPQLTLC